MLPPALVAQLGLEFQLHVQLQERVILTAVDAATEDVEQGHHVTLVLDDEIKRVAGSQDKGYALPRVELLELTSLSLESEPLFRLLLYGQFGLL